MKRGERLYSKYDTKHRDPEVVAAMVHADAMLQIASAIGHVAEELENQRKWGGDGDA